jgi:hypothetical protein
MRNYLKILLHSGGFLSISARIEVMFPLIDTLYSRSQEAEGTRRWQLQSFFLIPIKMSAYGIN